jgi:hypothetical protein
MAIIVTQTQTKRKYMADNNKTPYELRWDILKEMISITQNECFVKREIEERNSERSGKRVEYHGDFPLHEAVQRAEHVYKSFICKK